MGLYLRRFSPQDSTSLCIVARFSLLARFESFNKINAIFKVESAISGSLLFCKDSLITSRTVSIWAVGALVLSRKI